ncbi:hypothetical protein GCM10007160_18600 [Litchfieldella qijiaojingensis]|uniref:N-formylglutamate amidohydrolase n=1 Tax=Litchfieldella qijiaojingensis TaxID=980347 RepID=A0ABQ2YPT0_9GAMM|nr:N-formylglutamate amidohydrolase [Halomonas qijiaojingensis]GGX91369.1 hypothetical protein GCM10007160_18600 [Halomonas qijiaojingensis]
MFVDAHQNIATRFTKPAYTLRHIDSSHPVMLLCEHASDYIPESYDNLGLPSGVQREHIGWDIGALALAQSLSDRLEAPLVLANYSRLLIDLNRPVEAPDSIPSLSDGWRIPGNVSLAEEERMARRYHLFQPFHAKVSELIDHRMEKGIPTRVVAIHSFTPAMHGQQRPWEVGVLYAKAQAYAEHMILGLTRAGVHVGDNQPYQIHPDEDVTVPVHGDGRGLPCVLLEVRNDLLRTHTAIERWAERLAPLL